MHDVWADLQRSPPEAVTVDGVELRRGSRVRLRPRARGDVFDQVLAGRVAIVEGIDEGIDGERQLAVTIEDDPGRDLGGDRYLGHRFFYGLHEVEPIVGGDASGTPGDVAAADRAPRGPRVLVAGIGNVFLADDGFGVAVAQRLADRPWPPGVDVRDFGIRGMDLAYAMQREYDAVILVDAAPLGAAPGTLSVIDAATDADGPLAVDAHGMDPVKVLALARALGRVPPRVLVVACEPERVVAADAWEEMEMGLSAPVAAALEGAASLVTSLVDELRGPPAAG
jgi:hydrogenase maturation protease